MPNYNIARYLIDDLPRTLFPLNTNRILTSYFSVEVLQFVYEQILSGENSSESFVPQLRCHASKQGLHLRRTMKLDPVAELFIYDFIYRNRRLFRNSFRENRLSFGYRFENGRPISINQSYVKFKSKIVEARNRYPFAAKFDVSSYFNSIYHHDIVSWFSEVSNGSEESAWIGKFLREINSGRSIDCLPHGIHPCKVIGAEFLKFIDNSINIRSHLLLRFMDDMYLFDSSENTIKSDFIVIQQMLGEKGLSLNSEKTKIGEIAEVDVAQEVDSIKASLLEARRTAIEISAVDFDIEETIEEEQEIYDDLDDEQIEYLLHLLRDPEISESDAELVLVLLKDRSEDVLERMHSFLERFPCLSKNLYVFCNYIRDKSELTRLIRRFLAEAANVTEYQLFWIGKIAEEHLSENADYPDIIHLLYNHDNSTVLTKAKVLEIPENRFGLPEIRSEILRVGRSDWLSWAAAVGCRKMQRVSRNHVLRYFGTASTMNRIVADCVGRIESNGD